MFASHSEFSIDMVHWAAATTNRSRAGRSPSPGAGAARASRRAAPAPRPLTLRVFGRRAPVRERRRRRGLEDSERHGCAVVPGHARRARGREAGGVERPSFERGRAERAGRQLECARRGGRAVVELAAVPGGRVRRRRERGGQRVRARRGRAVRVRVRGGRRRHRRAAQGRARRARPQQSALAMRGSPLAPGVRAHTEPSVDPNAREDQDELADGRPERGARIANAGSAGESARMLDVDGAGESAQPAADALLPTRGLVIAACSDAPLPASASAASAADAGADTSADARRTGARRTGETGVARARAPSRSSSGLSSGTLSMRRTLANLLSVEAGIALAMGLPFAVESVE
jgi:hypothetical protein